MTIKRTFNIKFPEIKVGIKYYKSRGSKNIKTGDFNLDGKIEVTVTLDADNNYIVKGTKHKEPFTIAFTTKNSANITFNRLKNGCGVTGLLINNSNLLNRIKLLIDLEFAKVAANEEAEKIKSEEDSAFTELMTKFATPTPVVTATPEPAAAPKQATLTAPVSVPAQTLKSDAPAPAENISAPKKKKNSDVTKLDIALAAGILSGVGAFASYMLIPGAKEFVATGIHAVTPYFATANSVVMAKLAIVSSALSSVASQIVSFAAPYLATISSSVLLGLTTVGNASLGLFGLTGVSTAVAALSGVGVVLLAAAALTLTAGIFATVIERISSKQESVKTSDTVPATGSTEKADSTTTNKRGPGVYAVRTPASQSRHEGAKAPYICPIVPLFV